MRRDLLVRRKKLSEVDNGFIFFQDLDSKTLLKCVYPIKSSNSRDLVSK